MILDETATMLRELRQVYEPAGCGIWLYAPHGMWDGMNVVEMIEAGRMDEVLRVLDQLLSGAFA